MVVNEGLEVGAASHNGAVALHHVADTQPAQALANPHLCIAGAGGIEQKPADEDHPQPAEARPRKEPDHTESNEAERNTLACPRGGSGRAGCIAGEPPEDRSQHAPTVEREAGYHVEDGERDIDVAEPHEHRQKGRIRRGHQRPGCRSPSERRCDSQKHQSDNGARNRASNPHPELRLRVGGLLLNLCHSAEREQSNRPDGEAAGFSHGGM